MSSILLQKHYNPYSGNFASQSFSKAVILTIAVKALGMPSHIDFYLV